MSLHQHERLIWSLAYRMLGSAADADEVVQDCFLKALEKQPEARDSLRPWLVRVATNLCRDRLRGRKRAPTWLPDMVATDQPGPEDRVAMRESATVAYLVALEALTPRQRAVLLLRDVFDFSAAEVAHTLDSTEGGVRAVHLRARRAMQDYASPQDGDAHTAAVMAFMGALAQDDLAAARQVLAEDVVLISDGGTRYSAARVPVYGPRKVWGFMAWLRDRVKPTDRYAFQTVNHRLAMVFDRPQPEGRESPRAITTFVVRNGRIQALYSQVCPEKHRLCGTPTAG